MMRMFQDRIWRASPARLPTTTNDPGKGPGPSGAAPPERAIFTTAPASWLPRGTSSSLPDDGGQSVSAAQATAAATTCNDREKVAEALRTPQGLGAGG